MSMLSRMVSGASAFAPQTARATAAKRSHASTMWLARSMASESGTGAPAAAEAAPAPAGWGDDDNGWGDDDNWDTPAPAKPAVGSTEAQPTPTPAPDVHGVEALPGETDAEYAARQARLREEAAARMRAKFGGSGGLNGRMGGCGS